MNMTVESEDVWAASIDDTPGALGRKLAVLAEAGADLEFIIARRAADKPGTSVVFVTPLRGDAEIEAASEVGFNITSHLHSFCVQGENEQGIAAKLTAKLGAAGINLRGASGAVIGERFVLHFAVDTQEAREKAMRVLRQA